MYFCIFKINFFEFNHNLKTTDIRKIAKYIANSRKLNKRKRIVVITRAEKPIVYCIGNKVNEIATADIPLEDIMDTSCAGDAFVGGFLAQYLKNECIEKCIDCGNWAAGLVIQRHGTF
jgi:adenosine kinase